MNDIDATLEERGTRYGRYEGHAKITQALKDVMQSQKNWQKLRSHQKETLEMIAHKIGRILNGDPHYHDSWHDIVGYAKLSADLIAMEPKKTTGHVELMPEIGDRFNAFQTDGHSYLVKKVLT